MDCYIDPSSTLDHSSTSFASWLGLLNRGVTKGPKPSISKRLEPPEHLVILFSAVIPLIYTGASLDWRHGRGSIYNTRYNTVSNGKDPSNPGALGNMENPSLLPSSFSLGVVVPARLPSMSEMGMFNSFTKSYLLSFLYSYKANYLYYRGILDWLVSCFTAYQPFWGHLMPNQVILIETLF